MNGAGGCEEREYRHPTYMVTCYPRRVFAGPSQPPAQPRTCVTSQRARVHPPGLAPPTRTVIKPTSSVATRHCSLAMWTAAKRAPGLRPWGSHYLGNDLQDGRDGSEVPSGHNYVL